MSITSRFTAPQRARFAKTYLSGINGMRPTKTFCPISGTCQGARAADKTDMAEIHELLDG